jgi:single-strand DNA-binding protein
MSGAQLILMTGNLASDPELTYSSTGAARARLSVAVQDRYRDAAGEFKDGEPYFARCVAWGDLAERISSSVRRGDRVMVTGAMVGRSWDKDDGTKGYAQELRLEDCAASLRFAEVTVRRVRGQRPIEHTPDRVPDRWSSEVPAEQVAGADADPAPKAAQPPF